ncbi:Uncharacterised protein [BD1-7 clade bacterium]|uniref:CENP-V/GFA domain-containing protein n=1 Tax=BD1-7 clade bacterium TaxID=2029982 RepID=A0A5S9N630_9GAMM|nr:Uncharacterised protein [BD1-7 clade bacterium]
MKDIETSCLCGSVKIAVGNVNPKYTVCHCDSCRAWGGAPFFAMQCGTDVKIKGEDNVKVYASSAWADRGFCAECGTHLFFKFKKSGEYNMPVGLFPNLDGLEMNMQFFSDRRPSYYCFSNQTKEMTSDEIFAHFAATL